MKSLGEILKKQMGQHSIGRHITASLVVETANKVLADSFGQNSRRFAQAVYFKDRAISITCLSSVMAQEIKLNEKKILLILNQKLGAPTVEKIRYLA